MSFYGFFAEPVLDLEIFVVSLVALTVWGFIARAFIIEKKENR